MQNYNKLIKAIQKAVPGIMECRKITEIHGKSNNNQEWAKVIPGRDITLEDVLKTAYIGNIHYWTNKTMLKIIYLWKLNQPLHLQSDEVKELLCDLIK